MNLYAKYINEKQIQNKCILDGLLSGLFGGAWAFASGERQNETEKDIAEENLDYQKERNDIEDARYEEETGYNRSFAEDERNYQRAFAENQREYERELQQQIFNREDTAIERQANQLSKLGINPLSQQLNGLGAGQALTAGGSSPSAVAGASSTRGGTALHNSYRPSEVFSNMMTPILSFANSLNNLQTGGFQRDLLREQADHQRLLNDEQALINADLERKLNTEQEQREEDLRHSKKNNPNIEKDKEATANRNSREDVFQEEYGVTDNTPKEIRWATDSAKQAERASNYVSDKVGDLSKSATSIIVDNTKKAFSAYNNAMKKADKWLFDKWNKTKNWFKKHTASSDEVRNMYGF